MIEFILKMMLAVPCAAVIHEGGHYLAALCFGHKITFRFSLMWLWDKIPVPSWSWEMPYMSFWKQRIVALAGFGTEFLFVLVFFLAVPSFARLYGGFALLHLLLYPHYSTDSGDFKWL